MVMYKHKNIGRGTVTVADTDGTFHVIFPGGTVSMNRIYEGKGIICTNKDGKETKEVTIEEPDYMSEQKEKPKKSRKNKEDE